MVAIHLSSFLVGDLVPEGCEVWDLYILLLNLPDQISYLRILIEEHHLKFRKLYPDKTMIPKMHYMLHYPRQILFYGPLICTWTMRHEARLSVIKRASSHGNFKNICFTIAKRSMHALCYHLNCGEIFLYSGIEVSNVSSNILLDKESEELRIYIADHQEVSITHPRWIKMGPLFVLFTFWRPLSHFW